MSAHPEFSGWAFLLLFFDETATKSNKFASDKSETIYKLNSMKSTLIITLLLFVTTCLNATPYELNEDEISQEFAEVNAIERMVEANQISDLEDLKDASPSLYSSFSTNNSITFDNDDLPLGIPAFLWGCCFGLIGILLVVIITDNNKSATRQAAIGCLVSYGTIAVVYVILLLAGVLTAGFYSTI